MNNIFFFNSFQEIFEINTNIFETNLINLTIVFLVILRFLGDAINSILIERRQTIINDLNQSNKKIESLQIELNNICSIVEIKKSQLTDVYDKRFLLFSNKKVTFFKKLENSLDQLNNSKKAIIYTQNQEVFTKTYNKIILLIFYRIFKFLRNINCKTRLLVWEYLLENPFNNEN